MSRYSNPLLFPPSPRTPPAPHPNHRLPLPQPPPSPTPPFPTPPTHPPQYHPPTTLLPSSLTLLKAAAGGMPDLSNVVDGAKGVVQSASGQAKETFQSKQAEIQQNMQKTDFSERYDRLQKDLAAANAAAKKAIEY